SCSRPGSLHTLILTAEAFGDGHGLQLVHDPCARLHHPVPTPQELPQVTIVPARHLDSGKTILQQQVQNVLRIPGDRSSACVPASLGSRRRRPSTTRSSVPPAVAQTSVRVHLLPSPHAPSLLTLPDRDKTFPLPRDATAVAPVTHPYRCPQKQFAGSPDDNRIL